MPVQLNLPPTFTKRLSERSPDDGAFIGLWVCGVSPVNAELMASSGCDWVLLDAEHSPNTLETILAQLYAMSAYPASAVVRLPLGDTVLMKQYLDLGVQNLIIPMVESVDQAESLVQAVRYPLGGVRGVGAALARSSRWNRVENYLNAASDSISLTVQIESAAGLENVEAIAAVDGVDALFVGPADLSASMGYLGQQAHDDVVAGVVRAIEAGKAAGKPVGVNAFVPADADRYIEAGASFVSVGADVAILARQSEALVERFRQTMGGSPAPSAAERKSY